MKDQSLIVSTFLCAALAASPLSEADASPAALRNPPPECRPPASECGCPKGDVVQNGCEKLNADAGEGAPSSGSAPCAVKAFADADAVDIFSQSSLLPVIDGYAFRRLGSENLSDNETPALVTMMHPNGEAVRYRFHNGSATARPEPGAHRRTASRLVMVDADGAATTASPTYYDLYPGDGTRRRFRALGALDGHLGSFVSCTDARGVTVTPADMGVDVVYGTSGVRQMLTPSRLVDIAPTADWLGYDLTVHALTGTPARGAGGLYAVPSGEPLMRLRVRAENVRWRKMEVFLKKGGGEERRVEYLETAGGSQPSATETNAYHRFVYDGYLCVQRLDASDGNAVDLVFVWDALEKVATRPLMVEKPGKYKMHVTHDGNKNVSELVFFSGGSGIAAHYEYAPFGAVTASTRSTSTRVVTRSADGDTLSVTGTAVTPEFHTYGVANLEIASQTVPCRVHTVREGSEDSARFTTTYENMLGQTVREERSGFCGAILATVYEYDSYGRLVRVAADHEPTVEYAYDSLGARISTTRTAGNAAPSAPQGGPASVSAETEWRRSAVDVRYVVLDGAVWLAQTNTVSCSDPLIAPLVTSTARQLTGLTAANPSRAVATDERGNATETWTAVNGSIVTRHRRVPYATNVAETMLRYGDVVREMSISGVTDTYAYDALNRQVSHTNGRGSTSYTQYNALGLRSASIDALGNRTAYAYDAFGQLGAVTNPVGDAVAYEYDLRARKTYEGGATYPVRYTYGVFGDKTSMTTYRDEASGSGDVTRWLYDAASGVVTNKVYADGKGPSYAYTDNGALAARTWARGVTTSVCHRTYIYQNGKLIYTNE